MVSTTKTESPHLDRTYCFTRWCVSDVKTYVPELLVHVRQSVYSAALYILCHIADFHRHKVINLDESKVATG